MSLQNDLNRKLPPCFRDFWFSINLEEKFESLRYIHKFLLGHDLEFEHSQYLSSSEFVCTKRQDWTTTELIKYLGLTEHWLQQIAPEGSHLKVVTSPALSFQYVITKSLDIDENLRDKVVNGTITFDEALRLVSLLINDKVTKTTDQEEELIEGFLNANLVDSSGNINTNVVKQFTETNFSINPKSVYVNLYL